ncbi:MAG: hypothetical protein AAGF95_15035 [Chloroflexota bacterium]
MLVSQILVLIVVTFVLFLVIAMLAPLEALGWWAGWDQDQPSPQAPLELPALSDSQISASQQADCYVVYLSGVGMLRGDMHTAKERAFLDGLAARLPRAMIVRDIFPFSVTNRPLTNERIMAWFWRWIAGLKRRGFNMLLLRFVQIRNILQVGVSADRRYGPIYNFGVAKEIIEGLLRCGYHLGQPKPVILVCISGGGQVSVGTAPFLSHSLRVPIKVISIGGVLTDDPGIEAVDHLYHISGSKDYIQHIGDVLYLGRWRIFPQSSWNRTRAKNKITVIHIGAMKHMGYGDYFSRSAILPDGQAHLDKTLDTIVEIVETHYRPKETQQAEREKVSVP